MEIGEAAIKKKTLYFIVPSLEELILYKSFEFDILKLWDP